MSRAGCPTLAWMQRAVDLANSDEEFRKTAQWFDLWIQIIIGSQRFSLKIFMGSIIKLVQGPVPFGATFSLRGEEEAWLSLITSQKNRFRELLAAGSLATDGNAFETLRATKATALLIECIRKNGNWAHGEL